MTVITIDILFKDGREIKNAHRFTSPKRAKRFVSEYNRTHDDSWAEIVDASWDND